MSLIPNPTAATESAKEAAPQLVSANPNNTKKLDRNSLIAAFRRHDAARVEKLIGTDGLADVAMARVFVATIRESGCLLLKLPNPTQESHRDALVQCCASLLTKCPETTVTNDFKAHVEDAQILEHAFREVHTTLHQSEIWQRPPAEQAWAMINRSLEEFACLYEKFETEIKELGPGKGVLFDPGQFRLKTKDGHGTSPDAVINEVIQGLGMTLQMLAHLNNWFDATGTLILPTSTPCGDKLAYQAGTHTYLALQWRRLERAWERSRFFKARASLIDTKLAKPNGELHAFKRIKTEPPSEAEAMDRVAMDRLLQVFGQWLNDPRILALKPETLRPKGSDPVPLLPQAYVSTQELVTADVLRGLYYVPIDDDTQTFAGLSLKEWLRCYAHLATLTRDSKGQRILTCPVFTEDQLVESLINAGLSRDNARRFITLASLGRNTADIFDAPLLRSADGTIHLFAPALHNPTLGVILLSRIASLNRRRDESGDPANDCQFKDKGKAFERSVLELFTKAGMSARSFKYSLGKTDYDCDTAVLLGDTLFIFECKNYSLPMNHLSSIYYFTMELEGFKKQAKRIADDLNANPEIVRIHFGPKVSWKRVVPVVLYAMPWAVGRQDGVYVYDYSALARLIRKGTLGINAMGQAGNSFPVRGHQFPLRKGKIPTPEELEKEMRSPKQVMLFIAGLKLLTRETPASDNLVISVPEWTQKPLTLEQQITILGGKLEDVAAISHDLTESFPSAVDRIRAQTTPGQTVRTAKVGRNDPCPCHSGLKYKKCCLNNLAGKAKQSTDLSTPPESSGASQAEPQKRT